MPTTQKLAELFRALATGDPSAATAAAAQICAAEEKKGHRAAARQLRGALGAKAPARGAPESASSVATALVHLAPRGPLTNVVLAPSAREQLEEVVTEWQRRDELLIRGIPPRTRLLFHGPPGCGKSLTARALGFELELPVYFVRFDAVIGAFLGQTAINLRHLFRFSESTPCVLLLDELDALGKRRGDAMDVGELDRIVIALMQELEHSHPRGLIVGTSNMPHHLDDALWRRFDLALAFDAPKPASLVSFAKGVASEKQILLSPGLSRQVARSKSFASAEALVIAEARRQVLRSR